MYADSLKRSFTNDRETDDYDSRHTWEQWLDLCKMEAGRVNPALAVNEKGGSLVDFMDRAPLKDAFKRNMCPRTTGRFFGAQFEI